MKLFKSIIILAITLIATQAFSASIVVNPKFQAIDEDGAPLVGGCLYSYDCGTTSKAATCADYLCNADNTNPIELDARGEADVYSDQCFKLALYEADIDGVCDTTPSTTLIWTKDNIPSGNTGTATDGTTVLSLGTDGTDAYFIGDIQADDGTEVLENGTDGADSTYIGDIYATNGSSLILNSGTDGTNSTYNGDIYATNGTSLVLDSGTDGTNANIEADINADDGTEILENGTDGSNAIFTGSVVGNADTATLATTATTATKVGVLNVKVIDIGTWDMVSVGFKDVTHGIAAFRKIMFATALIRNDANTVNYSINYLDHTETASNGGIYIQATLVRLSRPTGGIFDGTDFDTMGDDGNRGWVTVWYID